MRSTVRNNIAALLGADSLLSIALGNIIISLLMIPVTLYFLEAKQRQSININNFLFEQFINIIKKPLFFAPALGVIYSATPLPFPLVMSQSLGILGHSTSAVALFTLGLIMSGLSIKLDKNVWLNIGLKNIIHPLFMMALVTLFGLSETMSKELILLCAMPSGVMSCIFALRYNVLTTEITSSTMIGTLCSFVTLSFFIAWLA